MSALIVDMENDIHPGNFYDWLQWACETYLVSPSYSDLLTFGKEPMADAFRKIAKEMELAQ